MKRRIILILIALVLTACGREYTAPNAVKPSAPIVVPQAPKMPACPYPKFGAQTPEGQQCSDGGTP